MSTLLDRLVQIRSKGVENEYQLFIKELELAVEKDPHKSSYAFRHNLATIIVNRLKEEGLTARHTSDGGFSVEIP